MASKGCNRSISLTLSFYSLTLPVSLFHRSTFVYGRNPGQGRTVPVHRAPLTQVQYRPGGSELPALFRQHRWAHQSASPSQDTLYKERGFNRLGVAENNVQENLSESVHATAAPDILQLGLQLLLFYITYLSNSIKVITIKTRIPHPLFRFSNEDP